MSDIDMNKVNVIIEMTDEHLKTHEDYRFACKLSVNEKALLEKRYDITSGDEYHVSTLYTLTKKQTK